MASGRGEPLFQLLVFLNGSLTAGHRAFGPLHDIGVSSPQQIVDTLCEFSSWSDSGADTHTIAVPDTNITFTAYFNSYFNYAVIDSIVDEPNDQGGWIRIYFQRSRYDDASEAQYPIAIYDIHRRVDNPSLIATILAELERVTRKGDDLLLKVDGKDQDSQPRFLGKRYLRFNDRDFVVNVDPDPVSSAPPGVWLVVGNVSAQQQDQYIRLMPTIGDSSEAIPYSFFYISAHTTTPAVFFDSPVDSGYSVDNIAPAVPEGFMVAYNTGSGNQLVWSASIDPDFQYFKVYRGTDPDFVPGPGTLVQATVDTSWTDPEYDGWDVHYKLTALDYVGNESDATLPDDVTAIEKPVIPDVFALYQNVPNPFNPTTVIRYDVPAGGGQVTLRIYDVAGRLVRSLVDGIETPGEKRVTWYGRNEHGSPVATGVYFYRMTAPGFEMTKKMVLLR